MVRTSKHQIEISFYQQLQSDQTIVPNMLLRHYKDIGLSSEDCLLLLSIIGAVPKNRSYVTYHNVKDYWKDENLDIQSVLTDFTKRKFLTKARDATIEDAYTLDGLYDKLYELFVYIHACPQCNTAAQGTREVIPKQDSKEKIKQVFALFEGEFGRPLSPTEAEKISKWLIEDNWDGRMIKEALTRAVLHGTCNLIYIDKILGRWQKEGIASIEQLAMIETKNTQAKTASKSKKKPTKPAKIMENETDYSDIFGF